LLLAGSGCNALHSVALQRCLLSFSASSFGAAIVPNVKVKVLTRAEDLSTLAAELCNLGMFVQHAPLVRKAIQLALEGAGALSARHLASLAQACGVLGNVPKAHMLVSTGSLLVMSKHSSLALISPPPPAIWRSDSKGYRVDNQAKSWIDILQTFQ
jgi:hypothetical protein